MSKKHEIYRAYITKGAASTNDIAAEFGVSRFRVNQIVQEVRNGSEAKLNACIANLHKQCKWQTRFLPWYEAICDFDSNRDFKGKENVIDEFRIMLRAMRKAKFSISDIAFYTGKDHSTIRYHLSKK